MVLGYSRGGNTAMRFVDLLGKKGISVWSLITFDPHSLFGGQLQLSRKISHALNFFQRNKTDRWRVLKGDYPHNPFKGASVVGATFENDYTGDTTVTHNNIVDRAYSDFKGRIDAALF